MSSGTGFGFVLNARHRARHQQDQDQKPTVQMTGREGSLGLASGKSRIEALSNEVVEGRQHGRLPNTPLQAWESWEGPVESGPVAPRVLRRPGLWAAGALCTPCVAPAAGRFSVCDSPKFTKATVKCLSLVTSSPVLKAPREFPMPDFRYLSSSTSFHP